MQTSHTYLYIHIYNIHIYTDRNKETVTDSHVGGVCVFYIYTYIFF